MFLVKILRSGAQIPLRGSSSAAGYDLYHLSEDDVVLRSGERRTFDTGIAVQVPSNCYGRIAPRSSLAKRCIDVCAGVIDADYRGEVKIMLHNHGRDDQVIGKGDRIAQLILERIVTPDVTVADELEDTHRQDGGFGSTGR